MSQKTRYTDVELQEFKSLIEEKIVKAKSDLDLLKSSYMNDGNNGTEDTAPTFKAFEEGSETMSKEANTQLAIRQEKFIRDLRNALIRIENKTTIFQTFKQNRPSRWSAFTIHSSQTTSIGIIDFGVYSILHPLFKLDKGIGR